MTVAAFHQTVYDFNGGTSRQGSSGVQEFQWVLLQKTWTQCKGRWRAWESCEDCVSRRLSLCCLRSQWSYYILDQSTPYALVLLTSGWWVYCGKVNWKRWNGKGIYSYRHFQTCSARLSSLPFPHSCRRRKKKGYHRQSLYRQSHGSQRVSTTKVTLI